MNYMVDAGKIVEVREVTPRAAAIAVAEMLGPRTQWPITVHAPAGDESVFVPGAAPPKTVRRAKAPRKRKRA